MATYKTPDVYVEEISVFPPSVAEVETAVPAFIGYTEKSFKDPDKDLAFVPTVITSFKEYQQYYGEPQSEEIEVTAENDGKGGFTLKSFKAPDKFHLLYYSVKMYFDNGGGKCYIVSVGAKGANFSKDKLLEGLAAVGLEDEPTLIIIPEAVMLPYADYSQLVKASLKQCGDLGDRFAILDAFGGDVKPNDDVLVATGPPDVKKGMIAANRDAWDGSLKYGAVYYPFLLTTLNYFVFINDVESASNVNVTIAGATDDLCTFKTSNTNLYNYVKGILKQKFLTLPPSGAVAGVYAATDTNRGVWKAPANVGLLDVLEPVVKIDRTMQNGLNVDPDTGKSVNAIRAFAGKGTLVWGGRTLAGNDNEWRYISVRRFFNMVEESVKKSTYWAVFEPNDANTWVKVRGMIENYLTQKWREGALAGATPKEAFFVRCGLGTTMTQQDILEGRMNVEIGMAVVRPAEFIILKFSHKMQTS